MATEHMTRFDGDLFEAAADEGRREHRSARRQLEYWARLGRELSVHETAPRRRILAVVQGEAALSELDDEEQLVANLELNDAIRQRAAATSFGEALLEAGTVVVALNADGELCQFFPDGTTRPFAKTRDPSERDDEWAPPSGVSSTT